jgi:succinate-semialdehyde dehydrogenase/glutarate-semialdehyde dehydrogenase
MLDLANPDLMAITAPGEPAPDAVLDPATGNVVGHVPRHGAAETRAAIARAHAAFPAWRDTPAKTRAQILLRWFDLVMANQEDLARLMTAEQGKPLTEARGEIAYAASFIEWFAEEAKRAYGDVIPTTAADRRFFSMKQPVGVCAAITPWNFPAAMITRKAGPALAAGCTMVVKPAPQTPLSAYALRRLAVEAGVPEDALIIVTGPAEEIGPELTSNPTVRKLSFTGSTAVGKKLIAACADTVKRVSMELGGNAPFIVFDDADLDAAVAGAMASKFRNTGQTCVCANRVYAQAGIYDAFCEKLAEAAKAMKVGNGFEAGVEQGPLIDENALAKVERLVADATAKGAKAITGGKAHGLGGTYYEPTVLTGVTDDMDLRATEIFGPVAPVYRFETEAEIIERANDTPFGLAGYFFSRDVGRVWRVAEALECGIVAVNTGVFSTEVGPFGGFKESGIGREGASVGLDEYLETKFLCLAGM